MVRGIPNISFAYTMPHSGKMSFPVESSSLIYSHFKYVSGVPATNGIQGITINKLNLLDVLIDQLNRIKRGASPTLTEGTDTRYIDSVIESFRVQIEQAKAASATMPYIPSPSAQPGAVLNLTA